jgi:hypothetical protein
MDDLSALTPRYDIGDVSSVPRVKYSEDDDPTSRKEVINKCDYDHCCFDQ